MAHATADNNSTFRKQSVDSSTIEQKLKPADTSNSIFRPQKLPNVSHVIPTLIDSDPPDLEDAPPPTTRINHKPANLFLDDENDQDDFNIFDDKTAKTVKPSAVQRDKESGEKSTASQIASINLFADDDSDNFDSFLSTTTKATSPADVKPKTQTKVTNLFEDDDDDFEDELFLQPETPSTAKPSGISARTNPATILSNAPKKDVFLCNLFDDEPPEDDFDITVTARGKVKTTPEASTSKISRDIPEEPKIIPSPAKSLIASHVESPPKKAANLFSPKINLFDDDDEDDIFEKLITPKNKEAKEPTKQEPKGIENELKVEITSKISEPSIDIKTTETAASKKDEADTVQASKKTSLSDPIRLFDDTPPSDDDEQLFSNISTKKKNEETKSKLIATTKQSKGEFYNDFSDTITSVPEDQVVIDKGPKIESLNSEKSPEKVPKSPIKVTSSEPETGKRSDFLKKIDAFSNPATDQKTESVSPPKVRQPKKLKVSNMDINVAALLPGARPSKSSEKISTLASQSSDEISSDAPSSATEISTTSKVVSHDNVDSSGRLTNLNRNRAKNLSRRPSTRTGRRQQYQKSLQSEDNVDESSDSTDNTKPLQSDSSIPKPVVSSTTDVKIEKAVDNVTDEVTSNVQDAAKSVKSQTSKTIIFEDDLFETDSSPGKLVAEQKAIEPETEKPKNVEIDSNIESEDTQKVDEMAEKRDSDAKDVQPSKSNSPTKSEDSEVSKSKDNPFSFLDDDDEENDDFAKIEPKSPPKQESKGTVSVKATPAYIDELPPELDPVDEPTFNTKTTGPTSLLSENALSLFGDDDDDDFDNDPIFSAEKSRIQTGK